MLSGFFWYNTAMHFKTIKQFFEKHERLLMPATLILGTAVDFVTFLTINIEATFWILGVYYVIAAGCIFILNTRKEERLRLLAKFLMQFTFGALLSASLVFYWFSGAFSVSWPIMILLALLMVSNEVFKEYYLKPIVQISAFYFVSFSLATLALPYAVNSLEPVWFVVGGVGSFLVVWMLMMGLSRKATAVRESERRSLAVMVFIFVGVQVLYFANVIPPIPLSLREAGVYHNITRSADAYRLLGEEQTFLQQLNPMQIIHVTKNDRVFLYSSIFAPSELNTQIFHRWQYFNASERMWMDVSRYGFYISGGRQEGYRGYSLKTNLAEGTWRVQVETTRRQVLGSVKFRVEIVEKEPALIEMKR